MKKFYFQEGKSQVIIESQAARMITKFPECDIDFKDLVQEGWIIFLTCRKKFDPAQGDFEFYLSRALQNKFIRILNVAWRKADVELIDGVFHANPEDWTETAIEILETRLSENEVRILKLFINGKTHVEISKALNMPLYNIDAARAKIKNQIAQVADLF